MRTPPLKSNFERPIGASTPRPSAPIADMRRDEKETRGKCENLRDRLENLDKDLENLGRHKNKKVNYRAERNPEGPYNK